MITLFTAFNHNLFNNDIRDKKHKISCLYLQLTTIITFQLGIKTTIFSIHLKLFAAEKKKRNSMVNRIVKIKEEIITF